MKKVMVGGLSCRLLRCARFPRHGWRTVRRQQRLQVGRYSFRQRNTPPTTMQSPRPRHRLRPRPLRRT